jgi:hypothetical protein
MKRILEAVPTRSSLHLYLRRSTEDQADSLDIQRDVCAEYVAREHPTLVLKEARYELAGADQTPRRGGPARA